MPFQASVPWYHLSDNIEYLPVVIFAEVGLRTDISQTPDLVSHYLTIIF
jgi:hypothetical protein